MMHPTVTHHWIEILKNNALWNRWIWWPWIGVKEAELKFCIHVDLVEIFGSPTFPWNCLATTEALLLGKGSTQRYSPKSSSKSAVLTPLFNSLFPFQNKREYLKVPNPFLTENTEVRPDWSLHGKSRHSEKYQLLLPFTNWEEKREH